MSEKVKKLDELRLRLVYVVILEVIMSVLFKLDGNSIGVYVATAIGLTVAIAAFVTHARYVKAVKKDEEK